jgi:hypothetical protein
MIGAKRFLLNFLLFVVLDRDLAAPLFDADFTALCSFHDCLRNVISPTFVAHSWRIRVRGIGGCCERTVSGHAAVPPIAVQ